MGHIVHAVEDERLSVARVDAALRRQQQAKERFLAAGVVSRPLSASALRQAIGCDEHRRIECE